METPSAAFRTIGPRAVIGEGSIVPHYLADLKLRISVARVGARLVAFDDLCPARRSAARSRGACSRGRR